VSSKDGLRSLHVDHLAVVQQPVQDGGRHDRVTEDVEMPQRLIGESLRSGWLTRIIPSMAAPFRSVIEAQGGDPA